MLKLRKTTPSEPLLISMTAVRLGDRLLIIGCTEPKGVALLATKPGLSGRACAVDEDGDRSAAASTAAQHEGALLEIETAPVTMLPYDPGSFDVVVVNNLLPLLAEDRRTSCLAEALRVVREGGRCIVMQRGRRGGLAGLLGGGASMPAEEIGTTMTAAGFRAVRTIADRDGLLFVEGGKR